MNYNFPILACTMLFAAAAPRLLKADDPSGPASGQRLVARAAVEMGQQPSIEAKLRQRVALLGKYLVGAGSYRHLRIGTRQMLRLEIKLQVEDRLTSLLQVSDGARLWIRRDSGREPRLEYVRLRPLREAMAEGQAAVAAPAAQQLALGGIQELLRGLDAHFQFGPPTPGSIGELDVWQLYGCWKPATLAELLPEQKEQIVGGQLADLSALPPHLPHVVALTLGRDEQLPLFPYKIEYGQLLAPLELDDLLERGKIPNYRPVATMELFEVRRYTEMDPRHFNFQIKDEEVVDRTEAYLERLRSSSFP